MEGFIPGQDPQFDAAIQKLAEFQYNKFIVKIRMYARIAQELARASTCARVQVGAVLLKDWRIIATGWNGVASGRQHCKDVFKGIPLWIPENNEKHRIFSSNEELHAEQNIIGIAAKNGISTNDTTLVITTSPCSQCAKLLIAAGIKCVYYIEEYDRDPNGIILLKNNKIEVEKINLGA